MEENFGEFWHNELANILPRFFEVVEAIVNLLKFFLFKLEAIDSPNFTLIE